MLDRVGLAHRDHHDAPRLQLLDEGTWRIFGSCRDEDAIKRCLVGQTETAEKRWKMLETCRTSQERWGGVHQLIDRWLADREFVTREEFDAVRAMAQKAREENEALKARLDALETGGKSDA